MTWCLGYHEPIMKFAKLGRDWDSGAPPAMMPDYGTGHGRASGSPESPDEADAGLVRGRFGGDRAVSIFGT